MNKTRSVLVIGGGPAGITAALQSHELGAPVTLLEADQVGGTSLNRGPAPVRTLARAARLARDWGSWQTFGLRGARPVADVAAMLANSERVARYAHDKKDMAGHLRQHGIALQEGTGPVHFVDPHTVEAADRRQWSADSIVVAVGGHAARLPVPGNELGLTYEDIPSLSNLPTTVAVVGGADTGCQIASILADLGAAVSIFEAGPTLVPSADHSVSDAFRSALEARGLHVHTNTFVTALSDEAGRTRVEAAHGTALFDCVFFAVGWPANLSQLNPDVAGLRVERDAILVDEFLRTNVDHIFAIGDVNGRSKLVQTARQEGRVAAHNAVLGPSRTASYDVIPSASFTDPEYGRVGLTEREAAQDHDIVIGVARYDDLLRPVADGRPEGFCKLIADRDAHVVLGAHVLGEYAAETVQTVAACMTGQMSIEQVASLQIAFPTFSEAIGMAAQKICRQLGVGRFPQVWSYLGLDDA